MTRDDGTRGPRPQRLHRTLPLNPERCLACPHCYSVHLYVDPTRAGIRCAACHYATTQANLAAGEAVWWERAAIAAANGMDPGTSGMRPTCPNCYGVEWLLTSSMTSINRYTCKECRTVWDDVYEVPHFRDRLLHVDHWTPKSGMNAAVRHALEIESADHPALRAFMVTHQGRPADPPAARLRRRIKVEE